MTCEVCAFVFDDVADTRYLHALRTHIKILHKALQSSDCEDCKSISADVDEDISTNQKISVATLERIKQHIKVSHDFEKAG